MQVNRLSSGLQEALKSASNFNTARSETLFDKGKYGVGEDGEIDFGSINVDDLNITADQISNLLEMFSDEIISIFGSDLPDMFGKNPALASQNKHTQNNQEQNGPRNNTVFTA